MSANTAIEWTDQTWNPVVGCEQVSPGCAHCYAKTLHDMRHRAYLAGKLQNVPQYAYPFEFVQLMPDRLTDPLSWRKPKRVFVNSLADLFHDDVPDEFIAQVFGIMALARRHTFQVLTKRAARMQALLSSEAFRELVDAFVGEYSIELTDAQDRRRDDLRATAPDVESEDWPLPNVWVGVSVENQRFANERIPLLLETPAAVRFLSCEPLLGPVDLDGVWGYPGSADSTMLAKWPIRWVIAGGESGRGARSMSDAWVRSLRDQCATAGVSFFYKQRVENGRKVSLPVLDGVSHSEFPVNV